MKENVRQTKESAYNQYYTYITRDDLLDIFGEDDVVLTIKNYETMSTASHADSDTKTLPRTVRFRGNWKCIDVRLVTNNGAMKAEQISDKRDEGQSAPVVSINTNRGPNRLKRGKQRTAGKTPNEIQESIKTKPSEDKMDCNEEADRRATAKALLHFAPNSDIRKKTGGNHFEKSQECMYLLYVSKFYCNTFIF